MHWMHVKHGPAKSVRGIDCAVKQCTAMPPRADFHWPRTLENQTCGHWKSANATGEEEPTHHTIDISKAGPLGPTTPTTATPSTVQARVADLLGQVDTGQDLSTNGQPTAARRTRRTH
jgi:hypothetical protein